MRWDGRRQASIVQEQQPGHATCLLSAFYTHWLSSQALVRLELANRCHSIRGLVVALQGVVMGGRLLDK
jgi:hypothetical protein